VFEMLNGLFVHAQGRAGSGATLIARPPSFALPGSATEAEIGATVFQALAAYSEALADPLEFANSPASIIALLKPIGLRSWNSLERKAKLCHVEHSSTRTRIVPTRNAGWRGRERGFNELPEAAVVLPAEITVADLGAGVRLALSTCTLPAPRPAA
jgi:hypothetical protein